MHFLYGVIEWRAWIQWLPLNSDNTESITTATEQPLCKGHLRENGVQTDILLPFQSQVWLTLIFSWQHLYINKGKGYENLRNDHR